jgi:predicted NBD/HSP70 family sugar kinase
VALRMAGASRIAVGVHIGVRFVRVGLVDLQGNLLALRSIPHLPLHRGEDATAHAQETVARIADQILALLIAHAAPFEDARLVGIGVGASGLVESRTGVNILAPRLGWHNFPLRDRLAERMKMLLSESRETLVGASVRMGARRVVVDNNVRCMALAESLYGVCRAVRALAFVYARVGVGSGLVVDRRLYRGSGYGAGEIGHWAMIPRGGDLCGCGNRGCLETLISEPALLAQAEAIQPELTRGKSNPLQTVFDSAREGHLALVELLEDRAYYVGLALSNLINVLNPQAILLGGWLSDAFDLVEPVISGVMQKHAFAGMGKNVELLPTSFGMHSGVIGAGVLALEQFVFSPEAWLE